MERQSQAIEDPIYGCSMAFILSNNKNYSSITTSTISATSYHQLGSNTNNPPTNRQVVGIDAIGYNSIDEQLKPLLEKIFENLFENLTGGIHSKCKDHWE